MAILGVGSAVLGGLKLAYKTGKKILNAGIWTGKKAIKNPGTAGGVMTAATIPGMTNRNYTQIAKASGKL